MPGDDLDGSGRNTSGVRLEYALVVTFLYDKHYDCNEYCKYFKNVENPEYKFIPAVQRTFYDGSISHVIGIITISQAGIRGDATLVRWRLATRQLSERRGLDGSVHRQGPGGDPWRGGEPRSCESRSTSTTPGTRRAEPGAVRASTTRWHGHRSFFSGTRRSARHTSSRSRWAWNAPSWPVIANRNLSVGEMFDRYESFMYRQWLRVYMRTQTIHHNKDLLQSVGDDFGPLAKLHIY